MISIIYLFALFATMLNGIISIFLSAITFQLTNYLGNVFWASGFTTTIATLFLIPFIFCGTISLSEMKIYETKWWWWITVILTSVIFYISIALTPAIIGFSLLVVTSLVGQLSTSIIIDHYGLFNIQRRNISIFRISCVAIAFLGTILIEFGDLFSIGALNEQQQQQQQQQQQHYESKQFLFTNFGLFQLNSQLNFQSNFQSNSQSNSLTDTLVFIICIFINFIIGCLLSIQAALNQQMKLKLGTPFRSALVVIGGNCISQILLSSIIFFINYPQVVHFNEQFNHWWIWVGGILSAYITFVSNFAPAILGLAPFFLIIVSFQLGVSLLFDTIGAFGVKPIAISILRLIGLIITFSASIGVQIESFKQSQSQSQTQLQSQSQSQSKNHEQLKDP
eukprot:TRINITY_DN2787_c0_g1_i1.p1 TRINITY_DN2787_c0_g1~~TRINITY_DN2787_c0_g1_i1.p1  ORF type:complete len:393 (+),score=148.48 TRINITY_DN2787_c0_g1_i1:3-1181(+)